MASNTDRLDYLRDYRELFFDQAHSEGIATLPSLVVLDSILLTYPIQNVLEIGRGLGTLTLFMGANYDLTIYSIESNQYCITASQINCLPVNYSPFVSIPEIDRDHLKNLNLVVIDGPVSKFEFPMLFLGNGTRIYFFENHQLITKLRVMLRLFRNNRTCRYVEVFPTHNFEGPSYVVSLPSHGLKSAWGYIPLFITILPRVFRHSLLKLGRLENPLDDSYHMSKWKPRIL